MLHRQTHSHKLRHIGQAQCSIHSSSTITLRLLRHQLQSLLLKMTCRCWTSMIRSLMISSHTSHPNGVSIAALNLLSPKEETGGNSQLLAKMESYYLNSRLPQRNDHWIARSLLQSRFTCPITIKFQPKIS